MILALQVTLDLYIHTHTYAITQQSNELFGIYDAIGVDLN